MSGHYATVQPTNWLQCRIPIKSTYQNTSCNVYTPYKYINGLGSIILFDAINKSTPYIMYNIVICFWVNLEEDSRSDWLECVPQGMRLWVAMPSCLWETVRGRRETKQEFNHAISQTKQAIPTHTHQLLFSSRNVDTHQWGYYFLIKTTRWTGKAEYVNHLQFVYTMWAMKLTYIHVAIIIYNPQKVNSIPQLLVNETGQRAVTW